MSIQSVTITHITLDSSIDKLENAIEAGRDMIIQLHKSMVKIRTYQNFIKPEHIVESFDERLYALNEFIKGVNDELRYLNLIDIPRLRIAINTELTTVPKGTEK